LARCYPRPRGADGPAHRFRSGRLTPRQREVYIAIEAVIAQRGHPPTVRELCKTIGVRSSATVAVKLNALKRDGFITWEPGKSRTIKITGSNHA
jgi:repressor LexA